MPEMPQAVFSGQGVLPELSRALHLEPGKLRKRRLPSFDDPAYFLDNTILAVYVPGRVFPINEW